AGAESQLEGRVVVPADAEPGRWRLALWLPDAAPSLQNRPEYAIRLANEAVWDERTGENVLASDLEIRRCRHPLPRRAVGAAAPVSAGSRGGRVAAACEHRVPCHEGRVADVMDEFLKALTELPTLTRFGAKMLAAWLAQRLFGYSTTEGLLMGAL